MPSILELQNHVRSVTVTVRGIKITLEEYLFADTKEKYKVIGEAEAVYSGTPNSSANASEVLAMDDAVRDLYAKRVCSRVKSWDITDAKGKPVDLTPKAIAASDVPFELMRDLLPALTMVPIVPEGSASPSNGS